jgi:hypothetical protein
LLAADGRSEARIVAHLAELDARRLHLKLEESLFRYCQLRLGLSDNQAYYRIAAARVGQRFPVVFAMLERRQIHLTNIAPLAKHLTNQNHLDLLRQAGRLSKRGLLEYLARRWPQPDVSSQIRRLPPKPGELAAGPTGTLQPLSETSYRLQLNASRELKEKLELARDLMSHANPTGDLSVVVERALDELIDKLGKRRFGQTSRPRRISKEPAELLAPSAQIRSAPGTPASSRAQRSTADHALRRFAEGTPVSHTPVAPAVSDVLSSSFPELPSEPPMPSTAPEGNESRVRMQDSGVPDASGPRVESSKPMRHGPPAFTGCGREGEQRSLRNFDRSKQSAQLSTHPVGAARANARAHIPNEIRRRLVERDGLRCSFVCEDGQRCGATAFLQIHHEQAWAKGGTDTLDNLRLVCASHNQWLAAREYGAQHMRQVRERADRATRRGT